MRSLGADRIECLGQTLRSHTPAFSMARRLIAQGYPADAEAVVVAATGTPGLIGTLGGFAALTVVETDTRGPRLARYRKNCFREVAGRPQGAGGYSPTGEALEAAQRASASVDGASW